MPDEFMTVAEVATILKLNQQTVRNWIDAGSLPAVRIGRRVRIKRSDFDAVVEAGYSGSSMSAAATSNIWDGEIPAPDGGGENLVREGGDEFPAPEIPPD